MPVNAKCVGRTYGPFRYEVSLVKLREFAFAVNNGFPALGFTPPPEGLNPLLYDEEAAKKGPYGEVVALPTFCVTFAMAPFGAAIFDPEIGIQVLNLVHGEQEFEFFDVIRAHDVMTTSGTLSEVKSKAGLDFVTVVSESHNQHGKLVVRGTWTAIVRN